MNRTDPQVLLDENRERLLELNAEYILGVQQSNPETFRRILAPDFLCTHADGSFVGREEFLRQVARPATITDLQAHDVVLRIEGTVAVVQARTSFRKPDGTPGAGRYTDIWALREGRWLCIAAHVMRGAPFSRGEA